MPGLIAGFPSARPLGSGQMARLRGLVARESLFERLSAVGGGVMLVCAPAGSGETVFLRSWVQAAGLEDRLAWVSIRRGERDAQRFWLLVMDALAGATDVVQHAAPAPSFRGEAVVDRLLADLELLEEKAVLVIDDLHELDSADASAWLETFLARLPASLRVVLATREDPRLEAVRQAQAARDWPLAARLLADNHIDLTLNGRTAAVCDLLGALPPAAWRVGRGSAGSPASISTLRSSSSSVQGRRAR
jgi:hypothetical protein